MKTKIALVWIALAACSVGACTRMTNVPLAAGNAQAPERPVSAQPTGSQAQSRAKAHVDLGEAYFQSARLGVALDEAKAAIDADANYAPAYHLMANVYMYLGDPNSARMHFERAIALAPGDPEINNSYGWFLCASGKEREGLDRLERAVRNPYYQVPTRAHTNSGLCLLRLGDSAGAETEFARAVQLDPKNGQALYHLADLAYRRQSYEQARIHISQFHAQREPTAESAWLGLRIERRLNNRVGQDRYAGLLGRQFVGSPEYQKMMQGKFE